MTSLFPCAAMAKTFQELFTPTLNRIDVSEQYVSSYTPGWTISRDMQINKRSKTKKTEKRDAFSSEVEHWHNNLVASFQYPRINKRIIYITTHEQKAPINMLSRSKTPKLQQVRNFMRMRITSIWQGGYV